MQASTQQDALNVGHVANSIATTTVAGMNPSAVVGPETSQPTTEDVTAAAPITSPSPAETPKKVPNWLTPFSTPQPIEPIDKSRKMSIFSGLTCVLMLPVLYGGLAGLTGFGMWYHFANSKHLLAEGTPAALAILFGPLAFGALLLLACIVPFVIGKRAPVTAYPLDKNENPAIFALVEAIAGHVNAAKPARVNVSIENSIRVEKADDGEIEVTLGLPLVATNTARQTAGYLAHELFKFSSQPTAKSWALANSIVSMFSHAAYGTPRPEKSIIEWGGTRLGPATVSVGLLPWIFEQIGIMATEKMTVGMLLDSDRSQSRVAGSNTFAMTHLDRHLLDKIRDSSQQGFEAAKLAGQRIENLPAFFANKLNILKTKEPEFVKSIAQQLMRFDPEATPPMSERIALAQQNKDAGVFPADKPSAGLFNDFTGLCRRITALHYATHFGDEIAAAEKAKADRQQETLAGNQVQEIQATVPSNAPAAADVAQVAPRVNPSAATLPVAHLVAAPPIADNALLPSEHSNSAIDEPIAGNSQAELPAVPSAATVPVFAVSAAAPSPPQAPPISPRPVTSPLTIASPPPTPVPPTPSPQNLPVAARQVLSPAATPQAIPPQAIPPQAIPPQAVTSQAVTSHVVAAPQAPANPQAPPPRQTVTETVAVTRDTRPLEDSTRDVLATFLQTNVITSNYELFLPLQEMVSAQQPEHTAQMLRAARQRFQQVCVGRKPQLEALADRIMRQRTLQMARALSLVGLPIAAEPLGLPEPTNAAAVNACKNVEQQLNSLRGELQEFKEQAVLRFVTASQLAATPAVAQIIGLHSGEIQACRLAIPCLAKLKTLWPLVSELGRQSRQLRCLMNNLNGNEHIEALTTSLSLSMGEVAESLRKIYGNASGLDALSQALRVPIWSQSPISNDCQELSQQAAELLQGYQRLYLQSYTILAVVGEKAEQHLGFPPLPSLP